MSESYTPSCEGTSSIMVVSISTLMVFFSWCFGCMHLRTVAKTVSRRGMFILLLVKIMPQSRNIGSLLPHTTDGLADTRMYPWIILTGVRVVCALDVSPFSYFLCIHGKYHDWYLFRGACKRDVWTFAFFAPTKKVANLSDSSLKVVFLSCSPVWGIDTS